MTVRNRQGPGAVQGYSGPRVGIGSVPAGEAVQYRAQANRWGAAADVFAHISAAEQEFLTRDSVEFAKQEGARTSADATTTATVNGPDGATEIQIPKLNKMEGSGRYAQAFNASAADTYSKRLELQARTSVKQLEDQYQADPAGLEKALGALQPALFGDVEAVDPAVAADLKFVYGAMGTDAVLRAKDAAFAVQKDANKAAILQTIATQQASYNQYMRRYGDPVAQGLAKLERSALEAELIKHGPQIPYIVNGRKYPAGDGSVSAEFIQQQMVKLDREGAQQTQLGWWESGPQTAARADAWAKSDVPGITQDQKDLLHRSFLADADRLEAKARAAANEARAQAQAGIGAIYNDQLASAANGAPIDPKFVAGIASAYPGLPGQKMIDRLYGAARASSDATVIHSQSAADDEAMLTKLAPVPGQPTTDEAMDRYTSAATVVNEKREALQSDPAGYVQSVNPAVADMWKAVAANPADPNAMKAAINATQQQQVRYGIPPAQQAAMPKSIAEGITQHIMGQETLGEQFQTFMSYAEQGDEATTRAVMRDLTAVKGGLPKGADLIADIAIEGGDRRQAEKLWGEMAADTKGVTLDTKAKEQITQTLGDGILGVLQGQAAVKGDAAEAISLAGPLQDAVEQSAKARVLLGADPNAAAISAAKDMTGQLALISDASFAQVYYSTAVEAKNPGAVESGLLALRQDVAATFAGNPYSEATGRDILSSAVWVNDRDGFSLTVPGSNRYIRHVSLDDAVKRGLLAGSILDNPPVHPGRPANLPPPVEPMVSP